MNLDPIDMSVSQLKMRAFARPKFPKYVSMLDSWWEYFNSLAKYLGTTSSYRIRN